MAPVMFCSGFQAGIAQKGDFDLLALKQNRR
jgi:hypothetical protein